MNAHKNARTTPFGRAVMVRRVLEEGWSVAAVATTFEVSTRTVRKWLARFGSEGVAGLQNRSSAPHLVANKLAAPWLTMVTRLRRDYRMTGAEIAARLRLPRSTVASHLRRLGLGRLAALEPSEPARPYNRARAGELIHVAPRRHLRHGACRRDSESRHRVGWRRGCGP
jgi:transposase